jgi:hypothetical protein
MKLVAVSPTVAAMAAASTSTPKSEKCDSNSNAVIGGLGGATGLLGVIFGALTWWTARKNLQLKRLKTKNSLSQNEHAAPEAITTEEIQSSVTTGPNIEPSSVSLPPETEQNFQSPGASSAQLPTSASPT